MARTAQGNLLNSLFFGDNLDILRRYIDDESVDLIYLDPPFNSNADYNVLFAEKDGTQAHTRWRRSRRSRGLARGMRERRRNTMKS